MRTSDSSSKTLNAPVVPPEEFRFNAVGTDWSIRSEAPLQPQIRDSIMALIEDFDLVWSRFRADSLLTQIARAPAGDRWVIPERGTPLLGLYDRLVADTSGGVDPFVGLDLELLGYDADYTLTADYPALKNSHQNSWATDVVRNGPSLRTHRPLVIDVGAAGKEFLVDLVAKVIHEARIDQLLINASGDLRDHGFEPVQVGLEHPQQRT